MSLDRAVLTGILLLGQVERVAAYPACTYSDASDNYVLYPDILFYSAPDGTALHLDAYVPNFVADPPLVELIHGGGFIHNDRSVESGQAAYFANQGFAVINIDYRLVTRATLTEYFAVQVPDARCALRWAIANAARYGWAAGKLGVTGMSAGATIAADVALTGDRSVALDGTTALDAATCPFGTSRHAVKAMNLYYGLFAFERTSRDGAGALLGAGAADISPISYVTPASPPAFLENGSDDKTLPPAQSKDMAAVLAASGVPYHYVELQGQAHNFAPQSRGGPGEQPAPWCLNVRWLHAHLAG